MFESEFSSLFSFLLLMYMYILLIYSYVNRLRAKVVKIVSVLTSKILEKAKQCVLHCSSEGFMDNEG